MTFGVRSGLRALLVLALAAPFAPAAMAQDAPLEVTGREVVVERDRPQICFAFNQRLERPALVGYGGFVSVDPPMPVEVVARDRSLCVEGPAHGSRVQVTLRAGLPAATGADLRFAVVQTVDIPNRAPAVAFRGAGYVLSRVGPEGLDVRTVNVERLRFQVLRIADRALVERIYFGRLAQTMTEVEMGELVDRSGEVAWQGEAAVEGRRNQPVQTAFPVGAALAGLPSGVYIATAADTARTGPGARATQWFIVSDLGLVSLGAEDGLTVSARRIAGGEAAAGAELRLLSRAGREIANVRTGPDGLARIPAAALAGTGDAAPQALFAHADGGDFAFLDLMSGADAGDARSGVPEALVVPDRRVYRPTDTIHAVLLRRDEAGRAVAGQRTLLRLVRPDGGEAARQEVEGGAGGGAAVAVPLPPLAEAGRWTLVASVPGRGEIGRATVVVDDQRPSSLTLDVRPDRTRLDAGDAGRVEVEARYVYGGPGEGLPGEVSVVLREADAPFPGQPGFRFGLAQTPFEPRRIDVPGFTTDAEGRALATVAVGPPPETTHPLEAAVRVTVVDVGGRAVTREAALPVTTQPLFLGVRPLFDGDGVPEGATAAFEVVAVDRDGARIARDGLRYEVYEESFEFSWFEAGGRWDYRRVVKDRRVGGGEVGVGADAPARIEQTVPAGRYRLEVFDGATGAATSVRFAGGWWAQVAPAGEPDRVEVVALLPAYRPGETAWVYVRPPWRAQVLVALADRQVRQVEARTLGPEGGVVEIPVDAAWTTGMSVLATAVPVGDVPPGAPRRAAGHGWIALDPASRTLDVAVELPAVLTPGATVEVPVRVAGVEPGGTAQAALVLVDEGAAPAWDDPAGDPVALLFGPRRPAVEIRDGVGRLPVPAASPAPPPPAGDGPWTAAVPVPTVASGVVALAPDGTATVALRVPETAGTVRLVAVAWSGEKVGRARTGAVVRDAVDLRVERPRLLSVDDRARVQVEVRNLDAPAGPWRLTLVGDERVTVGEGAAWTGDLGPGAVGRLSADVTAAGAGPARLLVRLDGPDGFVRERALPLTVRPAETPVVRRLAGRLLPDQTLAVPGDLLADLRPDLRLSLSLAAGPLLPVPALAAALEPSAADEGGPVDGSLSAVAARLLARLSVPDPASGEGAERTARALARLLALQRPDGAFAAWTPRGAPERWLSVFAVDVLARARDAGIAVPEAAVQRGRDWVVRLLENSWIEPADLPTRAYAYWLLARLRAVEASPVRVFAETWGPQLPTDLARAQMAAALTMLGEARRAGPLVEQVALRRSVGPAARDQGSVLRDLAAAYVVLSEANAAPADRLGRIAEQIAALAAEAPAFSTQEAGWLLRAARLIADKGGEVRVTIDGQAATSPGPQHRALDPAARVRNAGAQPLSDVLTVAGTPTGPVEAASTGLTLQRRILDMDGAPVDLARIRRNDLLVVVLEGRGREGETHSALLVDPVPAGFAVETVRTAGSPPLGGFGWVGDLGEASAVEVRDDGVVAALEIGPLAPTFRLVHVVRAVVPGAFAWPAARVEDLWRPGFWARTDGGSVRIED